MKAFSGLARSAHGTWATGGVTCVTQAARSVLLTHVSDTTYTVLELSCHYIKEIVSGAT